MQFGRVLDADGGGYPALGMARVTVVYTALGYEQDASVFFCQKGRVKAGDAAADDYIVVLFNRGLPRCITGFICRVRVVFELQPCGRGGWSSRIRHG